MAYDKVSTDVLRSALAEPLSHEVASNAVAATTESIIFFMSIVLYCCFFVNLTVAITAYITWSSSTSKMRAA